MKSRIKKIQKKLENEKIDAIFITNPVNIFYLTGFRGVSEVERESTLLIKLDKAILFTSQMYEEETRKVVLNNIKVEIVRSGEELFKKPLSYIKNKDRLGFEARNLKFNEYEYLKKSKQKLKPTKDVVENIRIIKDESEIEKIRKAQNITRSVLQTIINKEDFDISEIGLCWEIKKKMIEKGAETIAFEPIVASGKNSSLPHYKSNLKKIRKDILLMDAGARYQRYNGDMTRTTFISKLDKKFLEVYKKVENVKDAVVQNLKAGVKCSELYNFSVKYLGKESKFFIHGLGHGVGLDIHEPPYLGPKSSTILQKGMIVTIEPGLYYPGWGGVRIEDMYLITKDGCEEL